MPDFIPVGDEAKLEIDVSGPNCESVKSFEFLFKRADDGKSIGTVSGEISDKRMGSGTWTATGLKDEEMSCRVLWEAKADDMQALGRGELVVYRSSIEVTAKDADGAPMDKTMVHVKVVPDPLYGAPCRTATTQRTDGTGKVVIDDLPPGEVTVAIWTPFRLLEWVKDSGPTRECKVDKTYSACFVWPDVKALGDEPHKQYVNLPVDPRAPEQGSLMKIRAKVDTAVTAGGGINGDKIFLKVKFGANNSDRNADPVPGIGGNVGGKGKGPFVVEKALTADGGEVEFELELGAAGGDEVEVSVGGDEQCTDASFKLVTWRKLWLKPVKVAVYDLPNDQIPDDLKAKINETFEPVFIECEFESAMTIDDDRAILIDRQRAEAMGIRNAGDAPFVFFSDGGPEKRYCHSVPNDNPLRVFWLLGNSFYDEEVEDFKIEFKGRTSPWRTSPSSNSFLRIRPDGTSILKPWRNAVAPSEPHKITGYVKPGRPAEPSRWEKDEDTSVKGTILDAHIEVHESQTKFRVVLPATTPGIGKSTAVTAYLRLNTYSGTAGSSTGSWVAGAIKKSDPLAGLYTILHEIGHSLGHAMSDNAAAPGLPAKHPNFYTHKGHQGSHCNYGLSTSNQAKDNYTPLVLKGTHGTCIMFGGIGPKTNFTRALKFCPHCGPYVRATKMEAIGARR